MASRKVKEKGILISQFKISTTEKIKVKVIKENNIPVISIGLYGRGKKDESYHFKKGIKVPVALLTELRRMVSDLETTLTKMGLSDEFADLKELKEEKGIQFAHPSEEEFAKLLDFYEIKWLYEPRTFPIRWDEKGNVTESFTPDFYLPGHDTYIEFTTRKQSLITKNNQKIRKLSELYPELKIKVFYGRDYRKLLYKYEAKKP